MKNLQKRLIAAALIAIFAVGAAAASLSQQASAADVQTALTRSNDTTAHYELMRKVNEYEGQH